MKYNLLPKQKQNLQNTWEQFLCVSAYWNVPPFFLSKNRRGPRSQQIQCQCISSHLLPIWGVLRPQNYCIVVLLLLKGKVALDLPDKEAGIFFPSGLNFSLWATVENTNSSKNSGQLTLCAVTHLHLLCCSLLSMEEFLQPNRLMIECGYNYLASLF